MTSTEQRGGTGADFDHRDRESAYDPWPRLARLRAEEPVAWSEHYGGYWVVSTYQDAYRAGRDADHFSAAMRGTTIPELASPLLLPGQVDPPEHHVYRRIVNPFFSMAKVAQYEPWISELAQEIVPPLLKSGRVNIPIDLGMPFVRRVTLRIMGIEDAPQAVHTWTDDLVFQHEGAHAAFENLTGFLTGEVQKRRNGLVGDDFISHLIKADYEGERPLTDDEILRTALLILLAGLETTNSAISGAVWYLVQNPPAREQLAAADDTTWRLAMDEFVRWTSPAPAQSRTVSNDLEMGGCPMRRGERIHILYGSANRDEEEFENPDDVILDRHPNRHLGFGIGVHRCLGSHLAKAKMKAVLQQLIGDLGNWEIEDPDTILWTAAETRGIKSLPLMRRAA